MFYTFLAFFIFLLDICSKFYVNHTYNVGKKIHIFKNRVYIYLTRNKGIAYGIFKNFQPFIYILSFVCLFIISIMFKMSLKDGDKIKKLSLSFALGGAFGNIVDRIYNKSVTDFIYIKYKKSPIFNIADISILIACILFFIHIIIHTIKISFYNLYNNK